jgi:signal transduction histidine kinase
MKRIQQAQFVQPPTRLGLIGYLAIYLAFLAVVVRTLTMQSVRPQLPIYLVGELLFLILYSAVLIATHLPCWVLHLYFAFQSALILWMISIYPEFDFLILLYLLLSAQVSLVFGVRMRWIWVGVFVLLSGGSLMFYLGVLRGLSLSLTTIAGEIVIPAYVIVYFENEVDRRQSQALLSELQETNQRLQLYVSQVEDLTALQERNRLARQLHDSISQLVFSISLTTRSAQLLLESDPARLPEQLDRLKAMTSEALSQLRSLITRLRPPEQA